MTYTIIDPTVADYEQALCNEERKLEQAKQRLLDLEEAAWELCLRYINMPQITLEKVRECSSSARTIEALRQLARRINFPEWNKL